MLIKALCDYFDLQQQESESDIPDGYEKQQVHFMVHLRENGEIAAISDCRIKEKITLKNGKIKEKLVPDKINLPERSKKTGVESAIIEHRPLYLFGLNYENGMLTPDDKTNKARKSHEAFVKRNSEFFEDLDSPICKAYYNFITNFDPEKETENEHLKGLGKDYSGSYFEFALYDDITKAPQDDPGFIAKFQSMLSKGKNVSNDVYTAVCPVMGEKLPVARIHDKIRFPGGNTTGCVLVGMKESAYESYGKTQSYNSNISEEAMKKYTAAFNYLLESKMHRIILDGMVIVFFAVKKDDSAEANMFSSFFGVSETGDDDKKLSDAMNNLKQGLYVDYNALGIDENSDFYAAGFTPNSSRICQKFLVHGSFGKIMENMSVHQRDLNVDGNTRPVFFSAIFRELISPKSSKDEVSVPLKSAVIRAAAEGINYPAELLQTVIIRVKTDSNDIKNKRYNIKFNNVRIGIIKACLNRKARKSNKEEDIKMSLNENDKHSSYLCGRLFAVLEKIQQESVNGTLNTTIVDSYFSSACSKPASVFPKLVDLSNHHIKKLEAGRRIHYKKLAGSIIDGLDGCFPVTLDLEEQGRFIVGYYHQNKALWTSSDSKNNNINEEN